MTKVVNESYSVNNVAADVHTLRLVVAMCVVRARSRYSSPTMDVMFFSPTASNKNYPIYQKQDNSRYRPHG